MKASRIGLVLAAVVIVAVVAAVIGSRQGGNQQGGSQAPGSYDDFAKCLTDNGVRMYGAYWCPHCQNQEKMFGESWKYVTSIECSLPNAAGQTPECSSAGIKGYPTWEFSDGSRIEGEMPLQRLGEKSGCSLG